MKHLNIEPEQTGFKLRALPALVATTLILGGCSSIKIDPLAVADVVSTSASDIQRIRSEIEPLTGPLSLEESIARAIKYNLDRRVKMIEEAVSMGRLEVGNFDMLPKLVASAGYRDRNSDLISRSKDSVTGLPSLANPYISSDRQAQNADLSFTWNLLDFGQSYLAAKQSADRAMIAGERKRKALHLLIQDVRTAFWRAASAQRLKSEVVNTIAEAEGALVESRKAEVERLRNPLDSLRYQRQLLENLRLLEAVDQELASARVELASLTNLPLSGEMRVVEPNDDVATKWLDIPVERMEQQAISQNADLREAFYNVRLASEEARRGLLRLFPNLSFNYGIRSSSDSYLINQSWNEAGAQLSFNLLGLLAYPAQKKLGETGMSLADQQRQATLMGVMTQVHLARLSLGNAYRQYQRADGIWKVDRNIADQILKREQAETQTKLDRIANQTSSILSQLRRYQAMAQVHAAASKLQATLGMEPVIDGSQTMPVKQLSLAVGAALQQWDQGGVFADSLKQEATTSVPAVLAPSPVLTPEPILVPTPVSVVAKPAAAPESKALSSSAKQEVVDSLNGWVMAWSSQNVPAYLSAYSPAFKPADGVSREAWAARRKLVISQAKSVKLELEGIQTEIKNPQSATTRFVQKYQSVQFKDSINKTLQWMNADGRWQIVSETNATTSKR